MCPYVVDYRLRPAVESDYSLIEALYVETMKPLLSAFNAWNHPENIALFWNRYFKLDEASIVMLAHIDIGWLQVHEGNGEIALHQIHLKERYRRHNIGTRIIQELIARSERRRKALTLSLVKNNPALRLYERLGFTIVEEDETRFHMKRQAKSTSVRP